MNIANYKGWFFTFILFFFISCSATKIAYNFSDVLVLNWFESYFDFKESQRLDLEKKVERFFEWHRKSELPKVVFFLEKFKVRYKDGFDKDDINWVTSESKLLWKRILSYAEDDIASFLLSVDESQILELNEKFHEKEDDMLIEQSKMSLEALHKDILNRTYKALDNWLGDLEPNQKKQIATWIQPDSYWIAVKLRNREKFQNNLIDLLGSKKTLKKNIHSWMSAPESHWTHEYKTNIEGKVREWETITLRIDSITLPRQRKHVIEKIDGIIVDLKGLTGVEKNNEYIELTSGR